MEQFDSSEEASSRVLEQQQRNDEQQCPSCAAELTETSVWHEMNNSDGLNTHQVDVHRADVSDGEVSDGDRRERNGDITVVEFADPETLRLAHRRGANAGSDVEQYDIVESADPQTLQNYRAKFQLMSSVCEGSHCVG